MPPDAMISVLAATLLAAAWGLYVLPVGTCRECPHCRVAKLAREREHEAQVGRGYGVPMCSVCGRYHREEDHQS
jgi:hypothetical protein